MPSVARLVHAALACLALACLGLGAGQVARAAEGVAPDAITLVQTADLSGSRAPLVKALNAGTLAYLAHVNAQGGVHGRQVQLQTVDDGYEVARTERIVAERIRRDDVFAFVSLIGTANAVAALPLIQAARVPLVAPLSGAAQLRQPHSPTVFHLRASYAAEVDKMVEHVHTLGIRRVAVFYDDDAFGQDVLQAAQQALASRGLQAVALGRVARGATDVDAAVRQVAAGSPQVVICGSFGPSLVEFVRRMKGTGVRPTYYALSFFTAGSSIRQLGPDARGIGVTQVMPRTGAVGVPLVREFHELMRRHAPGEPPSAMALEGFVTAKVVVEALRRSGAQPTRARFVEALEAMRDVDLGALRLSYAPGRHLGLRFVDIAVVGDAGQIVQ